MASDIAIFWAEGNELSVVQLARQHKVGLNTVFPESRRLSP